MRSFAGEIFLATPDMPVDERERDREAQLGAVSQAHDLEVLPGSRHRPRAGAVKRARMQASAPSIRAPKAAHSRPRTTYRSRGSEKSILSCRVKLARLIVVLMLIRLHHSDARTGRRAAATLIAVNKNAVIVRWRERC